jgi:hypothetical protein
MKSFGCTPQSWPPMPDTTTHTLWQSWDMALESFLTHYVSLQRGSAMVDYRNNMPLGGGSMPTNISFFNDQLSAFEMWLEFGTATSQPPAQLPVVLQVLLSQSHRMRALLLLKKFLSLGPEAVKLSLILGIFPYILKLLQNPADDIKQTLISIWATVIGFDSSCRQELVREKSQLCFIQVLGTKTVPTQQRCLAAFVLAEVCNGYKEGQQSCLQLGLHRTCTNVLSSTSTSLEVMQSTSLKLWLCLCLFKLCEDFIWAKYLCITEAGHTSLYPLLIDPDPTVRTAAVLALGELFGASALNTSSTAGAGPGGGGGGVHTPSGSSGMLTPGSRPIRKTLSSTSTEDFSFRGGGGGGGGDGVHNPSNGGAPGLDVEERILEESELQLALQILECCTDGSVMVRLEAVYALSKFFTQSAHIGCIKLVAKAIYLKNLEKQQSQQIASKPGRRSASPGLEGNDFGKMGLIYPWHLTPNESAEITNQVEKYIKLSNGGINEENDDNGPPPPPVRLPSSTSHSDLTIKTSNSTNNLNVGSPGPPGPGSGFDQLSTSFKTGNKSASLLPPENLNNSTENEPVPELPTLMASAYVRLWLALTEVQGRDPHSLVAQAAATIRFRVHALISIDERNNLVASQNNNMRSPGIEIHNQLLSSSYSPNDGSFSSSAHQHYLMSASVGSFSPSTSLTNPSSLPVPPPPPPATGGGGGHTLNLMEQRIKKSVTMESLNEADNTGNSSSSSSSGGGGGTSEGKGNVNGNDLSSFEYSSSAPPLSPLGVVASNAIYSSPKSIKPRNVKFNPQMPRSSPFLTDGNLSENEGGVGVGSTTKSSTRSVTRPSSSRLSRQPSSSTSVSKYYFLEAFKDYSHLTEEDLLICFSSNHYEMVKKHYTIENKNVYDPYQDPLSIESNNRSYRLMKLQEVLNNDKILYELFKDVEDRPELSKHDIAPGGGGGGLNIGGGGGINNMTNSGSRSNAAASLSSITHSSCKFEQKSTLKMDSPMTTSLLMFHAFHDILVVASESSANIWSLTSHNRIVEVKNRHSLKYISGYEQNSSSLAHTPSKSTRLPQVTTSASSTNSSYDNSLFTPLSHARITSMVWINESYDSLLLLGSDDGVIKVWKDNSFSDVNAFTGPGTGGNTSASTGVNTSDSTSSNIRPSSHSPSLGGMNNNNNNNSNGIELATAFSALPDIAETSRGSGIVVSWQQTAGTLVVGGNSNTIRVWDLGREQNVRVFYTGIETCLTAMTTNTVSSYHSTTSNFNDTNSSSHTSYHQLQQGAGGGADPTNDGSSPVTWTFAGFADGSIAVYDERVQSNGGRVHFSHTHGTWVNYVHLRADVPEVVIGSVRGTVKFWDLRTMRTYKTLEVQKSPLTSLTVHNCAPILAAGSHAQFIKILTLSGEQLGNVIKYYDGFLGQRIGPVSCLAFHPHKLLLGASSTDGIVSIYHAAMDKFNS